MRSEMEFQAICLKLDALWYTYYLRTHALAPFRESSHRLLCLNIYLLAMLLPLIPLPNTGLDSQDRVGNVPELCALCTWTI